MADQGYRPHERLRTKEQYELVLQRKCTARGKYILVYGCDNSVGHSRLGRIVSKRWGNAVTRNKYRRWIREVYRLNKTNLPGIDIVVMITQKKGLCFAVIQGELLTLAQQVFQKLTNQ